MLSKAEYVGAFTLLLAASLSFLSLKLTLFLLCSFVLLCCLAPFFPGSGFYCQVVSRAPGKKAEIALTFDDGPDPGSTPVILKLLREYEVSATFYVVGNKAAKYPELIQQIVSQGHTLGNHSWEHDYALMLRGGDTIHRSVKATQDLLRNAGIEVYTFRPPVGIVGPRLKSVLEKEALKLINYSCRALDRGNRNIDDLAEKILARVEPGDIIMLHDIPLDGEEAKTAWKKELNILLSGVTRSWKVLPLAELLQTKIMVVNYDRYQEK